MPLLAITDEMVAGKVIDWAAVSAQVEAADLILAHNAGFDRKFLERACEAFEHKPWGCSNSQVDWAAEGFDCRGIEGPFWPLQCQHP